MKSIRLLSLGVLVAFVSACASGGGPNPVVCAAIGGLLGGAGGAAIGAAHDTGDDLDEAAGAGAGGALVGGALAWGLCKLLEKEEPPPPPTPMPTPTPLPPPPTPEPTPPPEVKEKIILRGVNFDFDKADIKAEASVLLDEAARILNRNPDVRVRVEGHTDSTGPEAYNQGLSERRAESVEQYLVGQGVGAERLTTMGQGESAPIASNATRDGRALNRRVELQVLD